MNQQILMNFSTPPDESDLYSIAHSHLSTLPDVLQKEMDKKNIELSLEITDMADETLLDDLDIDDPFELPAFFRSANNLGPGIESKQSMQGNTLMLFRRPLLDIWCESGDELDFVIRQAMLEEMGSAFEFSDNEIEDMISEPYD